MTCMSIPGPQKSVTFCQASEALSKKAAPISDPRIPNVLTRFARSIAIGEKPGLGIIQHRAGNRDTTSNPGSGVSQPTKGGKFTHQSPSFTHGAHHVGIGDQNNDPYGIRVRTRRPSGTKLTVTRGARAGHPRLHQTDSHLHLAWQDLAAVHDAEQFANQIGLPLTAFLTVVWRTAPGFDPESKAAWNHEHERFARIMKRFLKAHGVPVAFLFVRERVVGRGAHAHFMVHLPWRRWTKLKTDMELNLRAFCARRGYTDERTVKITGDAFKTPGMIHKSQRLGVLAYLAKGMSPSEMIETGTGRVLLAELLDIDPQPQASVPGNRVGWSANLNEIVRKAAGYRDTDDVLRLADQTRGRRGQHDYLDNDADADPDEEAIADVLGVR